MDRDTIMFTSPEKVQDKTIEMILQQVYHALEEKGDQPLAQMVRYILSGDPSYITGHNNARNLVRQVERDDLVEALLKNFLNK